jgi:methyl-accepting chemotaxis protein
MNQVTQGIAANAEESAAVAGQLTAQTASFHSYVAELRALVDGK